MPKISNIFQNSRYASQVVNVTDFDGVDNTGVTSSVAGFNDAIASAANKALRVPSGDYLLQGLDETLISIAQPITIYGDGPGKTVLKVDATTGFVNGLGISASHVILKDLSIEITSTSLSTVGIVFSGDTQLFLADNVEIDGTPSFDGIDTNRCHGIKVGDTATLGRAVFTNGTAIHDVHFGVFTANAYSGTNSHWIFDACHFYRNTADDLEFNSLDRAIENWNKLVVNACTFEDHPSATGISFAIGTDSGQEIAITSSTFKNYTAEAAVHIEDETRNIIVDANIFDGCRVGIEAYNLNCDFLSIQNNVLDGGAARATNIDPSTMADPDLSLLNNTIGIIAQRPTDATNTNAIIAGNIIHDYDVGMSCSEGFTNSIHGNSVSLCSVAYNFGKAGQYNFYDNQASRCKYVFWGATSSTSVSSIMMNECPNILFSTTSPFTVMDGITVKKNTGALTTGVTTQVPLFDTPVRAWGDECKIMIVRDDLKSQIAAHSASFTYDGVTLTAVRNMDYVPAAISGSNPMFTDTAGTLTVGVFHGIGSDTSFDLEVSFNTMFIFT